MLHLWSNTISFGAGKQASPATQKLLPPRPPLCNIYLSGKQLSDEGRGEFGPGGLLLGNQQVRHQQPEPRGSGSEVGDHWTGLAMPRRTP